MPRRPRQTVRDFKKALTEQIDTAKAVVADKQRAVDAAQQDLSFAQSSLAALEAVLTLTVPAPATLPLDE